MPTFKYNIVGVGRFYDHGCKVLFEQDDDTIISKDDTILLKGWHKQGRAKLLRFLLRPRDHPTIPTQWTLPPSIHNAHDLPIIVTLV